ncbi:MAG: SpoIIE family protein phosphatase [Ignavibacteriales bacterium]|nr:SpoIIE family protein phosphatase [Ignavibacteriales bacterium]
MNYKPKLFLIIVLVSLFASLPLTAQKHNLKFKTIRQSDGLINNSVISILQDSYGFVWLGTHQGLQRYDGTSFNNFENVEGDTSGLVNNYVASLSEDKEGNIWIGTGDGLNKYVRETEKIERIKLNFENIDEAAKWVWAIIPDKLDDNILYLSIHGFGLIKYNKKTNANETFLINSDKELNYSYYLLQDPRESNIIYLGASELLSFDTKTKEFKTILKLEQNTFPPNNLINDITVDPANSDLLWLATGDFWAQGNLGGLFRYDKKRRIKKQFFSENFNEKHILRVLFQDKDNLWIGSRGNGAYLYNKVENKFYHYKKNDNEESFGIQTAIRSMMKDNSGSIWFGGWEEALTIYKSTSSKFLHYKNKADEVNSLSSNVVTCFAEDEDGNIWIGTDSGGLNKLNPESQSFTHYFPELRVKSDQMSNSITYLFYDSRKNLWIGTFGKGLFRFNPKSKAKIHYDIGLDGNAVSKKRITSIGEAKDGSILISTYGGGLNVYNYESNKFSHYLNDPKDSNSISDNFIWSFFEDQNGLIYFGGNNTQGIIRFDPNKKIFKKLDLPITTFTDILESSKNVVYANDISSGLSEIIIGDSIKVRRVLTSEGLPFKNIEKILEDSEGNLWLGTTNGILQYNIKNKNVNRYGVSDGLQGFEFNRLSGYKSINGDMYFGGDNGFNVFSPQEIKKSTFKPNLVFTNFKLFDKNIPIDKNSVLKKSLLLEDKIELAYNQNDFSITYAALDFNNPSKIHYKYKLENHNENWSNPSNERTANYTNLDAGEYTFKVLATNSDGLWLDKPLEIKIIISPPWWETIYAYLGYGLILAVGIFGVDRFQRRRLLAKAKEKMKIQEAELRAVAAESQAKVIQAENERKSAELEEARQLQLSMLPKDLPNLPNLDIAVYMQTATEVGGDYYDFHVGIDGTLTVVIGDATGHGMKAGTMVTTTKSMFNMLAANTDILNTFSEMTRVIKGMKFSQLSMCLTLLKIKGDQLFISSAAMPPALIYRKKNRTLEEILMKGMPLGSMNNFPYDVKESQLESGDTILLVSDGLPELTNDKSEMYGYDRTKIEFHLVGEKEPEEIVEHLKNSASQWVDGRDPDDDVTFVVIKVK